MLLVPSPGPPFDVLGDYVDDRPGRPNLSRFLPSSCLLAPLALPPCLPESARPGLDSRLYYDPDHDDVDGSSTDTGAVIDPRPSESRVGALPSDSQFCCLRPLPLTLPCDARKRPASRLRVNQPSLMSEDNRVCPRVEDGLLSPDPKWADRLERRARFSQQLSLSRKREERPGPFRESPNTCPAAAGRAYDPACRLVAQENA
jgi:hypothetical protein